MSVISDFLKQILTAYYGKDVRQSIHDAIKQCYDDATGNPESVAAVVEQNDKMKELLENTPYTTVGSEGEFELPVHTINDSETSAWSTWSSEKISEEMVGISKNLIVISGNSTASNERTSITLDIPDSVDGVSRDEIISKYQIVLVTQTKKNEEGYLTQGPVFSVFEEIVYPSAFLNRNFSDPSLSYIRLYLDGTGFTGYIYYKIVLMKMQKKDPVAKPFDE